MTDIFQVILQLSLLAAVITYFFSLGYIIWKSPWHLYEYYSKHGRSTVTDAYLVDSVNVAKSSTHIMGVVWCVFAFPVLKAVLVLLWPIVAPYLILKHSAHNNFKQTQLADKLRGPESNK